MQTLDLLPHNLCASTGNVVRAYKEQHAAVAVLGHRVNNKLALPMVICKAELPRPEAAT